MGLDKFFDKDKLRTPEGQRPGHLREPRDIIGSGITTPEAEAVEELREPLTNMVRELKNELANGSYDLIIGDDASGRLSTIAIGNIAQSLAKQAHREPPTVRFLAGSTGIAEREKSLQFEKDRAKTDEEVPKHKKVTRSEKVAAVGDEIAKMMKTRTRNGFPTKRALIVTDTITTGESMEVFVDALKHHGIPADIATVVQLDYDDPPDRKEKLDAFLQRWGGKLVVGKYSEADAPLIWKSTHWDEHRDIRNPSGVQKEMGDVYATPSVGENEDMRYLRVARALTKDMAADIMDEVFPKGEEQRKAA